VLAETVLSSLREGIKIIIIEEKREGQGRGSEKGWDSIRVIRRKLPIHPKSRKDL